MYKSKLVLFRGDLYKLDVLSDKLLKIFEKRGGQIGQRLNCIMSNMTQGLCVYLNEDPEDLLREFV
ncbi:hypothetical protein F7725_013520, partial [Dissostichus mawsoni]